MSRGLIIQAPTGSGKSHFINNLPPRERHRYVDGDTLLENKGIKNRNYFWYNHKNSEERAAILHAFKEETAKGINILYSGNPLIIPTDILIIPPVELRWSCLQRRASRGEWIPSTEQFNREQRIYEHAAAAGQIPIVFNTVIPNHLVFNCLSKQLL